MSSWRTGISFRWRRFAGRLAWPPATTSAGANQDYSYYESPEGLQAGAIATTIKTLTGPGIITRFWMPHLTADMAYTVRMIVDGQVRIDTDSDTFLAGQYDEPNGYIRSPLVQTLIGGQVSYEPIVFQNSLVIESNNQGSGEYTGYRHYYQYSYHKLSAGTAVTSYTGTLTGQQQAARNGAVNMISNVGQNPAGASAGSQTIQTPPGLLNAGQTLTLASLSGSGQVRRINLKMTGATDGELDGLRLRVRYDGGAQDAIDVPVAHFFGAGHGRYAYKSLPLGTDSPDGFYSYWPMPFRQSVEVSLYNSTGADVNIDSAVVEYTPGDVASSAGYLHAAHNEEVTTAGQFYHELLNVSGHGHYVGNLLYLKRDDRSRMILEGDDLIIVDGNHALYGTGLEDAYNGGFYYNHVGVQTDDGDIAYPEYGFGPYHGLLNMDDRDINVDYVRTDQYRWLIGDPVPFRDGIEVRIENYGAGAGVLFGSTAFYYLTPQMLVGDLDGSGAVNSDDINPLVLALTEPNSFVALYGDVDANVVGDINGDGAFNGDDISPFVELLVASAAGALPGPFVPEPASLLVLCFGMKLILLRSRRKGV